MKSKITELVDATERDRPVDGLGREEVEVIGKYNVKAMRQALESISCINTRSLGYLLRELVENDIWDYGLINKIISSINKAEAALAAPPRNCDVGTVKDQTERFEAFCQSNMQFYSDMFGHDAEGRLDGLDCREDCPVGRMIDSGTAVSDRCQLAWAQMPYEERGSNG